MIRQSSAVAQTVQLLNRRQREPDPIRNGDLGRTRER